MCVYEKFIKLPKRQERRDLLDGHTDSACACRVTVSQRESGPHT